MMRFLCAGVLVLVFTSQTWAQAPRRPSFGERIKSWFTFHKPEPAETIHPAPKMKPPVRMKYERQSDSILRVEAEPLSGDHAQRRLEEAGTGRRFHVDFPVHADLCRGGTVAGFPGPRAS